MHDTNPGTSVAIFGVVMNCGAKILLVLLCVFATSWLIALTKFSL